jgi:hypothetical protein
MFGVKGVLGQRDVESGEEVADHRVVGVAVHAVVDLCASLGIRVGICVSPQHRFFLHHHDGLPAVFKVDGRVDTCSSSMMQTSRVSTSSDA